MSQYHPSTGAPIQELRLSRHLGSKYPSTLWVPLGEQPDPGNPRAHGECLGQCGRKAGERVAQKRCLSNPTPQNKSQDGMQDGS